MKKALKLIAFSFLTAAFLWGFYATQRTISSVTWNDGAKRGYEIGYKDGYGVAVGQCDNRT